MFHIRLSGEKPEPKPYYYNRMNPEELSVWQIIGEEKYEYVRTRKGKLRKRRLTPKDRAARQRMFYDTRVGHGVCGDDWMRKTIPSQRIP
ncbi:hypothetical protein IQ06DRAFT_344343 [Phaeosphaeriaceae sp. SRC1lsM3a]|nr:hypothetical protein IQ06DRAFT_344343 [Stagonospora sp. SRC1lsM3a]